MGTYFNQDPRAVSGGKKAARIAVQKAGFKRYVPQKKVPPKPDPGTWWLNLDRAAFTAEVERRDRVRRELEKAAGA